MKKEKVLSAKLKKNVKNISLLKLSAEEAAYIAGFLDGDGSIILQIIRQKSFTYGFTLRVSVCFFQKTSRNWFLSWLKEKLGNLGYLRDRTDNVSEYTITSFSEVKQVLMVLLPYLRVKKVLGNLALSIIERKPQVKTKNDFLEVCNLVDKAVFYTDSKKRKITSKIVEDSWKLPVETLEISSAEGKKDVKTSKVTLKS